MADVIDFKIFGDDMQLVEIELDFGEGVRAEVGAMSYMEQGIRMDTGIGGGIAEMIGRQLRELGEKRQVLCVTHLPQVASQAHQQLKVTKSKSRNHTTTAIYPLSAAERVEEIARMLGGAEITETTRNLALEMLDNQ